MRTGLAKRLKMWHPKIATVRNNTSFNHFGIGGPTKEIANLE